MALSPGARLGPYEIVALLGVGGMGAVYRARDTRPALGREVAIKILRGAAGDADSQRRFEQEARATGALNHPNILAIYDVGTHEGTLYLVEELVDGATLRESLAKGALAPRMALEYAKAVAQGLAAAHAKGIVHRDLKPENVMITSDGRVKILDFGLAKLHLPSVTPDASTQEHATGPGTVLGTVAYMSPEQVRGQTVDHRSDLFSVGVVLYEMLSGERPFTGDTAPDTQASILNTEPRDLPAERQVPPVLERIVRRCLEKQPERRFQSASDLAFALDALSSVSIGVTPKAGTPASRRSGARYLAAALLLLALGLGIVWARWPARPDASLAPLRLSIVPPTNVVVGGAPSAVSPARILALSPDGTRLAFTAAGPDGIERIWIRALDSDQIQPLAGTENAQYPFWSPDGKFLAFYVGAGVAALRKVDISGRTPVTICAVPSNLTGGTWNRDDVILFGMSGSGSAVMRVSAQGGRPVPATTLDTERGETRHWAPFFLPDGDHFLYLAVGIRSGDSQSANGLYVGSLRSGERKLLQPVGSNAQYTHGLLVFLEGQSLLSQPFDPQAFVLSDKPTLVAEGVRIGGLAPVRGAFTVSSSGVLAYLGGASDVNTDLVWLDRQGQQVATLGEPANYQDVALAPDGHRAAIGLRTAGNVDIWLFDTDGPGRTRLTFDPKDHRSPVWSPDGKRVAYASIDRTGTRSVFAKSANGLGAEEPVVSLPGQTVPSTWSSDGTLLLVGGIPPTLWRLLMSGDRHPTRGSRTQSTRRPHSSRRMADGWRTGRMSQESTKFRWHRLLSPEASGRCQPRAAIFRAGGAMGRNCSSSRPTAT